MRPGRSPGAVDLSHGIFYHEIEHPHRYFVSIHERNDATHNYRCHLSICGILAYIVKIVSIDDPTLTAVWHQKELVILAVSVTIQAALIKEAR